MSLTSNFISALLAVSTSFTGSIENIPMKPGIPIVQNYAQDAVDKADNIASSASYVSGVAVVDRAHGNSMKTNGTLAHMEFKLQSLGRLPILIYAVSNDDEVAKGNVPEIVSMMQGYSGSAASNMWEEYGGKTIITDLAGKYNLQETIAGNDWFNTKMSAVDIARLYRRFLDDDNVKPESKRWAISMMRGTSMTVSGQDFSWGLPTAVTDVVGVNSQENADVGDYLTWAQGWSGADGNPMVRSTTAILGKDLRHIVVVHGIFPATPTEEEANSATTKMSKVLVEDILSYMQEEEMDASMEKYYRKLLKSFDGDFVGIDPSSVEEPEEETSTTTKKKSKSGSKKSTDDKSSDTSSDKNDTESSSQKTTERPKGQILTLEDKPSDDSSSSSSTETSTSHSDEEATEESKKDKK